MRSSPEAPPRGGAGAGRGGVASVPAAFLGILLLVAFGPAAGAMRGSFPPAAVVTVHSDRPPAESTGGFGEDTCAFCHLDGELNEEAGELELLGLPEDGYVPGQAYTLTVRLRHPALRRAGFQLAVRFAAGDRAGEQAGTLAAGPGQTIQEPSYLAVEFLSHDGEGVEPAKEGEGRWAFEWLAPEAPHAPVAFHVAGNAANGDGSEWGDRIFTYEAVLDPER